MDIKEIIELITIDIILDALGFLFVLGLLLELFFGGGLADIIKVFCISMFGQ